MGSSGSWWWITDAAIGGVCSLLEVRGEDCRNFEPYRDDAIEAGVGEVGTEMVCDFRRSYCGNGGLDGGKIRSIKDFCILQREIKREKDLKSGKTGWSQETRH